MTKIEMQILEQMLLARRHVRADFGEWLRSKREAQKLSYRALAARVGLSAPFLHDVEMGRRRLSDTYFEKFAKALDVSVADLEANRCEMATDLMDWISSHPDLVQWLRAMKARTYETYR